MTDVTQQQWWIHWYRNLRANWYAHLSDPESRRVDARSALLNMDELQGVENIMRVGAAGTQRRLEESNAWSRLCEYCKGYPGAGTCTCTEEEASGWRS